MTNINNFDWDEKPELNITPLVDIMLVLLAILMVAVPTIVYKEDITLPKGSKMSKVIKDSIIEIRIDKNKNIYIKNNIYTYKNFVDNFNLNYSSYNKNTSVNIRADANISYGDIMFVLKGVKEAGFLRISLITNG